MKYSNRKTHFSAILLFALGCGLVIGCGSGWQEEEKLLLESQPAVLHVLNIDNPRENEVLRSKSKGVTDSMVSDKTYSMLAAKLLATVQAPEYDGVGIAAPQVGILRRVVAVMRYDKEGNPFEVYPNISIISFNGETAPARKAASQSRGSAGRLKDTGTSKYLISVPVH